MQEYTTDLYFESHITIEPVFDERLEELKTEVKKFGFSVADLLIKKRQNDSPTRSAFDTFCTSRSRDYKEIHLNTIGCVAMLKAAGFQVWRYKIEDTLLDVRFNARDRSSTKTEGSTGSEARSHAGA